MEEPEFSLEIPVNAAFINTVRLFAAALARHFGCEELAVNDLKLAISEAATNSLINKMAEGSTTPIRVLVAAGVDRLNFLVEEGGAEEMAASSEQQDEEVSTDQMARILGLELIRTLFPDLGLMRQDDGRLDLRFSIPLTS